MTFPSSYTPYSEFRTPAEFFANNTLNVMQHVTIEETVDGLRISGKIPKTAIKDFYEPEPAVEAKAYCEADVEATASMFGNDFPEYLPTLEPKAFMNLSFTNLTPREVATVYQIAATHHAMGSGTNVHYSLMTDEEVAELDEPMPDFEGEVRRLINSYSLENRSNTPDHILAEYLVMCLGAFNSATNARSNWYDQQQCEPTPNEGEAN